MTLHTFHLAEVPRAVGVRALTRPPALECFVTTKLPSGRASMMG